jgi:hypothetical protein
MHDINVPNLKTSKKQGSKVIESIGLVELCAYNTYIHTCIKDIYTDKIMN